MSTDYTAGSIGSGVGQQSWINQQLADIQTALERTLNLYGDPTNGANAMTVDFDMNSQDILNAGTVNCDDIVVGGDSLASSVAAAAASAVAAAASEAAAAVSETNAAASEAYCDSVAASITLPDPAVASTYLKRDAGNTTYVAQTALETLTDLLAAASGETPFPDGLIAGDPGSESAGITVAGTTYDSVFKASDIGGTSPAQLIIHRHSTTIPSVLMGTRANSDTNSHAVVTDGMQLFNIYGLGHDGTDYAMAGYISFEVDGTPGSNDMPGRITFFTTPDGTQTPSEAMRIGNDGDITFNRAHQYMTFNIGGQDSSDEQRIVARNASGGGGSLETVMIPRDRFNKLVVNLGSGGASFYDYTGVTSRMSFSSTGDMTAGSGRLWTIQKVDIGGSGTGNIDQTDIGQATPYYGAFNDLSIEATDSPTLTYYDSGGAANEKYWFARMNSAGTFLITLDNDALSAESAAITIERSGATLGNTTFGSPTLIATDLTMDSGSSGSGSVFGAATGGAQGSGTINAEGLYINGVSVGSTGLTYDVKTSNQTMSDTTFVNDNAFTSIALTAGKRYLVRVSGRSGYQTASNSGLKGQLTFTQTPQLAEGTMIVFDSSGTAYADVSTDVTSTPLTTGPVGATGSGTVVVEYMIQANATTGGTMNLQWASNSTGDAYLYAGLAFELIQLN